LFVKLRKLCYILGSHLRGGYTTPLIHLDQCPVSALPHHIHIQDDRCKSVYSISDSLGGEKKAGKIYIQRMMVGYFRTILTSPASPHRTRRGNVGKDIRISHRKHSGAASLKFE
jgi:hypothetical protein